MLARPGFAAAAILTTAVGIGANVATFSIVDAVVFRRLPYPHASSVVRVWSANPRGILRNAVSPPDYFDMRDAAQGIDTLAAFTQADAVTAAARLSRGVSPVDRHARIVRRLGDSAGVRSRVPA